MNAITNGRMQWLSLSMLALATVGSAFIFPASRPGTRLVAGNSTEKHFFDSLLIDEMGGVLLLATKVVALTLSFPHFQFLPRVPTFLALAQNHSPS